jgi:NTE family protein
MASRHTDRPLRPSWRAERAMRQGFAKQLEWERCKVERAGTPVTVVMPGPADLAAFGLNLMDGRRRAEVLRTAQVTVAAALRRDVPAAA